MAVRVPCLQKFRGHDRHIVMAEVIGVDRGLGEGRNPVALQGQIVGCGLQIGGIGVAEKYGLLFHDSPPEKRKKDNDCDVRNADGYGEVQFPAPSDGDIGKGFLLQNAESYMGKKAGKTKEQVACD